MQEVKLIFFIALALAPFAAAIAFIITYQEYAKHLIDKKRLRNLIFFGSILRRPANSPTLLNRRLSFS